MTKPYDLDINLKKYQEYLDYFDRDFDADLTPSYCKKLYEARIKLLALDPAMNNTGIIKGVLSQGKLWELKGSCINRKLLEERMAPDKLVLKSSWKAAYDLEYFSLLNQQLQANLESCHVCLAELPLGSQSAMAMKSYGATLALLASLSKQEKPFIPVKAHQVRSLGKTKDDIIQWAKTTYPHALLSKAKCLAEHEADALAVMHLGLNQEGLLKELKATQQLLGKKLEENNLGITTPLSPEEVLTIRSYERWLEKSKIAVIESF